MSDCKYDLDGLRFNEPQLGILYVIEFSSGWVKVGQTASSRSDTERLDSVGREFRAARGWDVTNRWVSDVRLSTTDKFAGTEYFDRKDRRSCSLDVAEKLVKEHAAAPPPNSSRCGSPTPGVNGSQPQTSSATTTPPDQRDHRLRRRGSPWQRPLFAELVEDAEAFGLGEQHPERGQVAHLVAGLVLERRDGPGGGDVVAVDDLLPPIQHVGEIRGAGDVGAGHPQALADLVGVDPQTLTVDLRQRRSLHQLLPNHLGGHDHRAPTLPAAVSPGLGPGFGRSEDAARRKGFGGQRTQCPVCQRSERRCRMAVRCSAHDADTGDGQSVAARGPWWQGSRRLPGLELDVDGRGITQTYGTRDLDAARTAVLEHLAVTGTPAPADAVIEWVETGN